MFQKWVTLITFGVVAWLGWSAPAEATLQNPTFIFAWCTKVNGQFNYWEMLKVEADDFIALCGGGGPPDSPTFIETWKQAVVTCRQGGVPDLSKPRHAKGVLNLKGGTYTTKIGCEKVFEIATNYGVISANGKTAPTIKFALCMEARGQQGPKTDLIEPDDFIAVCGGGGDIGTPTFIETWKKTVEKCRKGLYPAVTEPLHARGFLYIKGKTVEANIDCGKVFEIAAKYGVISPEEAKSAQAVGRDAAAKGHELMETLKRDSAAGVWQAKFLLAVKYLQLEPSSVAVYGNYEEGLNMVEQLAADGHGDTVLRYLNPIEEKAKRERRVPTVYSIYGIQWRLAKGGHAVSALKVCQTEVEQAILHFQDTNPSTGHPDAEALQKVQKGCGRAAELGGEKIKWLIDDLEKQVAIAQKASDERKEVAREAQGKAAKQLFEWIVASIGTAPPSTPRGKSSYNQCKETQDMALAIGDLDMIGAAHLVTCF